MQSQPGPSNFTLPYLTLPYLALPYLAKGLTLPCQGPYLIPPYLTLPCLTLPGPGAHLEWHFTVQPALQSLPIARGTKRPICSPCASAPGPHKAAIHGWHPPFASWQLSPQVHYPPWAMGCMHGGVGDASYFGTSIGKTPKHWNRHIWGHLAFHVPWCHIWQEVGLMRPWN